MQQEPKLPRPMIEPKDVAEAILHAAEHPTREKKVGTMSFISTTMSKIFPSMADRMAASRVGDLNYAEPARNPDGALSRSSEETGVVGQTHGTGGREQK
jgi:hypothetical protein